MTEWAMEDGRKTKVQLIAELNQLRRQLQALTASARPPHPGPESPAPQRGGGKRRNPDDIRCDSEQARYRDFVENVEDGCFEVDLQGIFTFVNQAMCRIHGYPCDELIGKDHRDYASASESKAIYQVFNTIYKTGRPARIFDYTIKHKDGTLRNLEVSASLIRDSLGAAAGFRGITRDRTDKISKERELARYRDFVENVDDACFEVDLKGDITFCNKAACRVFGYPMERFMGMNNREYTTAETARKTFQTFNRIYRTGEPAKVIDYEIIQEKGRVRYLDMAVSLIVDEAGKPVGFRGICTDVTERKQMALETERLNAMLSQAQRLEALGTLAGGVAHNFNNLFMSIQGNVSLMLMGAARGEPHRERLKTIEAHLKRGSELTAKLLGYAANAYQTAQITSINQLMDAAVARFTGTPRYVIFKKEYGDDVRQVSVDPEQLIHVFLNLFTNAEQAMSAGGTIYLSSENVVLDSDFVQPYHRKPGAYVKATVKDTGMGMDKETLGRIFEPFYTTKELFRGAGLGLAFAYGVVLSHGGIIDAESQEGNGSSFYIYLPSVKQGLRRISNAPPLIDHDAQTILLVDDDRAVVDVISEMITAFGYKVITANNAHEAVALFRDRKAAIDLVIMDMVMPGIGGDRAIEMLHAIDPQVKVILISGVMAPGSIGEARFQGGWTFLQKPIEPKALRRTIAQLLSS